MFGYYIRSALRQALEYKVQTALVLLGVAIGIANIILLISMTDLGRRKTVGLINDFGARILIVTPFVDFSAWSFAAMTPANTNGMLTNEMLEAVRAAPVLDTGPQGGVAALLLQSAYVSLPADGASSLAAPELDTPAIEAEDTESKDYIVTTLAGVTPEFVTMGGHKVEHGKWLRLEDLASGNNTACLGWRVMLKLFGTAHPNGELLAPDPEKVLGTTVLIKGESFTVIGIMKRTGKVGLEDLDNRVFIPLTTAQRLTGIDGVQAMFMRYREGLSEDTARAGLRASLKPAVTGEEQLDELVSIFDIREATKLMDDTLGIFRSVLVGIGSIALVVAGIGIMNVMLIRVLRRRSEIGLRRACGASRRSVVGQFMTEAVAQALGGAVVGVTVGLVGLAIFCRYSDWDFYVAPMTILLAVGFALGVGVLFGAYPAWRAAMVDPIESLRSEV